MKHLLGLILSIVTLQAQANLNQWLERQAYDFLKSELAIAGDDDGSRSVSGH